VTIRGAIASFFALAACLFAACTNGGGLGSIGGGGGGTPSPLPSTAVGVAIPSGKIGVENDPVWGTVSGYTQNQTSQVLAYPPGTKITVTNLSKVDPHTLNVLATTNGPPPQWPKNPSLSFSPSGNGVLGANYASGTLQPGKSVTVTLSNPGIYLIGCAFHYFGLNMRDVIQVSASASPGPTASPGPGGYAVIAPGHLEPKVTQPQPKLVDQLGREFDLASLRGTPLIVTFISAHCTDACPLINGQFADAARRIEREHVQAKLLTITLDPEHDTPQTMRALAQRFEANPRYWLLAAGTRTNVHAVMQHFGVISVEGKGGEHDEHTTFVYVLNAKGHLVKTMLASSGLNDDILNVARNRALVTQL
jgi:cytochrome oxidase Cu insertion factor (SCO1/SenC/PrrC family)/plastocyanin